MELLAILIALALFWSWGTGGALQQDGWFRALQARVRPWAGGAARQIAVIAVPAVLVALLHAWLQDALFGLASLAVLVAVLLYAFGRGDLGAAVAEYLERWSRGDFQAAFEQMGQDGAEQSADAAITDPAQLHENARLRLYYRSFERLFAVLFWFVVLGPGGAVAYRLAALEAESDGAGEGRLPVRHWLDWIPARLLAISFALVGDFDACLYRWRASLQDRSRAAGAVLEDCGNAALRIVAPEPGSESAEAMIARGAAELESVEVLHRRALLVWMVIIALLAMID